MEPQGHCPRPVQKAYALLITFQKTEKEFSPITMYADYPISRSLLHWESQSNTALDSPTGQNLVHHTARGTPSWCLPGTGKDTTTAQYHFNFWDRSSMSAMRVKGPSRFSLLAINVMIYESSWLDDFNVFVTGDIQ
ncbi:MAG: DUF3427 domain-containing protein [Desulfobacteraceae bacterium]|nr:DUF3427 domain-containing protein [Desulfobacteraceae bacterium]